MCSSIPLARCLCRILVPMHVLVIAGDNSPEREVSLRSGTAVSEALESKGYSVSTYDPKDDNLAAVAQGIDIAFPALHGLGGEDGVIQSKLEAVGLPYVGSGVSASELCFDKAAYKKLLFANNLPTPKYVVITTGDDLQKHELAQTPFVLKPYDGGSSIDTFIVRDVAEADFAAMHDALQRYGSMLLEELINGIEITVGVLGNRGLPVIEIVPPETGEFDYENKYNGATQELCPPQHVDREVQEKARALAAEIHLLCNCADLSRTDMIVKPNGELMVLETNTLPGMTVQSLYPKAAAVAGYSMPELCDELVRLALNRQTATA
jgi:D-alanine-D-alanine ligase